MTYKLSPTTDLPRPLTEAGPVLHWDVGNDGFAVIFLCPCGAREVYVTHQKGHRLEFDGDGRMTIHGSIGGSGRWKGDNLCHFFVRAGEVEMCADVKCPGSPDA